MHKTDDAIASRSGQPASPLHTITAPSRSVGRPARPAQPRPDAASPGLPGPPPARLGLSLCGRTPRRPRTASDGLGPTRGQRSAAPRPPRAPHLRKAPSVPGLITGVQGAWAGRGGTGRCDVTRAARRARGAGPSRTQPGRWGHAECRRAAAAAAGQFPTSSPDSALPDCRPGGSLQPLQLKLQAPQAWSWRAGWPAPSNNENGSDAGPGGLGGLGVGSISPAQGSACWAYCSAGPRRLTA